MAGSDAIPQYSGMLTFYLYLIYIENQNFYLSNKLIILNEDPVALQHQLNC